MKKIICIVLVAVIALALSACGEKENMKSPAAGEEPETATSETQATGDGDAYVDLTGLSKTMVFSEVYNMMIYPEDYVGKTIRIKGEFDCYEVSEKNKLYFYCFVSDAAACCSQGLEFVLAGEHTYPDDYPEIKSEITVTGVFETYDQNGFKSCRLVEAEIEN